MNKTLRTLVELALTHLATFAFPLVFALLCGRVLGVHDFGIVSFYTALAAFLAVIVEFGFDWLGIREVIQAGDDRARRHLMLFNVTAAKLLICAVITVAALPALLWLRGAGQLALMLAMVVHLIGFAFDVSWYLRAMERTRLQLFVTATTRLAGIVVLWLAVARPGSMAAALWSYTFVSVANAACGWAVVMRAGLGGPMRLSRPVITDLMSRSWAIVLGNLNGAVLTNGGVALLGFVASPATVGAANLALRVKMAGQAALLPIKQLAYTRLSKLAARPDQAVRFGRKALAALLGGGVVIGLLIAWAAERIVRQVFMGDHPVAVGLVMLLGLSVPLNAAAELLGMQCLIAFGRERAYAFVVAMAALVFCVLLLFVLHGELAYGWAVLAAEGCLTALAGLQLRAVLAGPRASSVLEHA